MKSHQDVKKHFKLYKAGKMWLVTALASMCVMVTGHHHVKADTTDSNANIVRTLNRPSTNTDNNNVTSDVDTSTNNETVQASNHSAVVASTQSVYVATNTQNTNNNSDASNEKNQQTTDYNTKDTGNYAALDNAKLDNNGQLNVAGWHTTNAAKDKPYHYIIAVDQNGHEIARQNVTNNAVSRPDVQKVHNDYGALNSGFNTELDVSKSLANTTSIRIISRYTNDAFGNGNGTDYWFAPITVDRKNYGHLDSVNVIDDQLTVGGWHASNVTAGKPYHYVILYDKTTGHEIARQRLTDPISRQDVAKAYPGVYKSVDSGFHASFDINSVNLNHQLQIVDRYSADPSGNSNNADYWFTLPTGSSESNVASLDSFYYGDDNKVTVSGWHADDISTLESNHYLILFDDTTNKQISSIKVNNVARPDVAKVYPSISSAGQSGFNVTFNLNGAGLTPGHTYSIVSRYSTSSQGNGGSGQYTDYWMKAVTLNESKSSIDSIKMTDDGLHISGWMASDYAVNRPYAYAIVLNNGKEVARQRLSLTQRSDVAHAYSNVYNSLNSGFNTVISLDPSQLSGNMQVILRFTDDVNGNGNFNDQYSQNYSTNLGSFDQIAVSDSSIYVSGWHASDQVKNKPYQYLIFIDTSTGQELYRQQVLDDNRVRADVENYAPYILNSNKSGYQLAFNIPNSLDHHTVRIIHRYTDDPAGNGNAVDIWSDPVSIHNNRWAWPFPQGGEGHFMGSQLFGVNPGGEFRLNGFHDGLDFGSVDHPGTQVHAIHSGTIVRVAYGSGLDWYVLEDTGEYLIVYQEAFSSRNQITVQPGQKIEVGDVIGNRNTSHVHIGITRQHNFSVALSKSFINDGTWLNPLEIIRNGLNG